MTSQSKSYDMLEAFDESSEAHTKLVLLVRWCVVHEDNCKATLSLNLEELLLKPGELMAWIFTLLPHSHVAWISRSGVDSNDSSAGRKFLTILQINLLAVVAVLSELLLSFWSEPVAPHLLVLVDRVVWIWRAKILNIDRPSIMITLDWKDGDICIFDGILDHISHSLSVVCDLLNRIVPSVVRWIVACPKYDVRLNFLNDVFHHIGKGNSWEVA